MQIDAHIGIHIGVHIITHIGGHIGFHIGVHIAVLCRDYKAYYLFKPQDAEWVLGCLELLHPHVHIKEW